MQDEFLQKEIGYNSRNFVLNNFSWTKVGDKWRILIEKGFNG